MMLPDLKVDRRRGAGDGWYVMNPHTLTYYGEPFAERADAENALEMMRLTASKPATPVREDEGLAALKPETAKTWSELYRAVEALDDTDGWGDLVLTHELAVAVDRVLDAARAVEELPEDQKVMEELACANPAPPSPETGQEWRPIETAPKDGRIVVILDSRIGRWRVTCANFVDGRWLAHDGGDASPAGWVPVPEGFGPLPEPPTSQEAA